MEMTSIAATVAAVLGVRPPRAAQADPLAEVVDGLSGTRRLVMVVIDAMGIATWRSLQSASPNVNRLAEQHFLAVRSVSPPITPVNFATMATGASPDVHRISKRTDRLEFETIFDVLRESGRSSATASRALSSVGIMLAPFAERAFIAESNTDEEVLSLALEALRATPDFLLAHFLDVDDAGHAFGPLGPESRDALSASDGRLRKLMDAMGRDGYSLLLLADHGQHTVEPEDNAPPKYRGTHNGRLEADVLVPVTWGTPEELG